MLEVEDAGAIEDAVEVARTPSCWPTELSFAWARPELG